MPPNPFSKKLKLLRGERWWGGCAQQGLVMPFGRDSISFDLRQDNLNNQAAPLLISNRGRYVWSEEPFRYQFTAETLLLEGASKFIIQRSHGTLRNAFLAASSQHFPSAGKTPPRSFFAAPQLNTWIELNYSPSQDAVLNYARSAIAHGFPPGVLMIDDGWQRSNGEWEFCRDAFPDPVAMLAELKSLGFRVMLWMIHCVSPDTAAYRKLKSNQGLIRDSSGKPVLREWWNGVSAQLDLTNDYATQWLSDQCRFLQRKYGVDGFKLDGGDFYFFHPSDQLARPSTPSNLSKAWAQFGTQFRYNEFRGCWKMGGQPLVQRLWDRTHSWTENGLAALIPNSIAQGLLGHPFICPDMIGGGLLDSFHAHANDLDQELIVRMAQCSALMPMMQFSAAPWRVLDSEHLRHCQSAIRLHSKFSTVIWSLARYAARTGEPILRPLCYEFPDEKLEDITDQFMLGSKWLVAPVLQPRAKLLRVKLPSGRWRDDQGSLHRGGTVIEIPVDLARLPHFKRLEI